MKILMLKMLVVVMSFLAGSSALAFEKVKKDLGFVFDTVSISPDQIMQSAKLQKEDEWNETGLAEVFRPFPEYKTLKEYNAVDGTENLEVYRGEVAFVTNKAAAQAFFQSKSPLEVLKFVDEGFTHKEYAAASVNGDYKSMNDEAYAGAQNTLELKRDRTKDPISPEEYDAALAALTHQYEVNSEKTWCKDSTTTCIQSKVVLGGKFAWVDTIGNAVENTLGRVMDVPTGIEVLSEISDVKAGEANWNANVVENIPYPALQQIVQTGILANAFLQYSKVIVSLHEYSSESQVLIVIQSVAALEKDELDETEKGNSRKFIMSQSADNRDEGASKGFPRLQYDMAVKLKTAIEASN